MIRKTCPNCGADTCTVFYSVAKVPTNSCLLVSTKEEALRFPTGDIELSFCSRCGFIFNAAWEASRTTYSDQYEETQGFSPTFNAFHRQLADELVQRHNIVGKDVLEIGCGKGEFLALLCNAGKNRGVGYDPSFVPDRLSGLDGNVRVVREFFSEDTDAPPSDFVCSKMTLEHIGETARFARAVRRIASTERGTILFLQIPDVRRILEEMAFWDIYYEHCSYFSPTSLEYLLRNTAFEVLRTWTGYDQQYLMTEARPIDGAPSIVPAPADELRLLASQVNGFAVAAEFAKEAWTADLRGARSAGRRTVLWGSGSKAVAFLTTMGLRNEIEFVVDINPYRHDKFIPGTGQRIVSPAFLADYRPDRVIAMNPIYREEIARDLASINCPAEIIGANQISSVLPIFREAQAAHRSGRV